MRSFGGGRAEEVATDARGDVFVAGWLYQREGKSLSLGPGFSRAEWDPEIFKEAFLVKISARDGSTRWYRTFRAKFSSVEVFDLAMYRGRDPVVAAGFGGYGRRVVLDVDVDKWTNELGTDLVLARFGGDSGATQWAIRAESKGGVKAAAMAIDGTGAILVTGAFRRDVVFPGRALEVKPDCGGSCNRDSTMIPLPPHPIEQRQGRICGAWCRSALFVARLAAVEPLGV